MVIQVKGFMTREFDKQRRDDTRPSFRDRSSNNHADERPSRPGRTRLNRETVDRAWESGAQQQHADYRPRSTNGQAPRNNWRNQQPSDYSSSQNSHGGNRPYSNNNNRQEHYRDNPRSFERTSDDSHGPRNPRARSFGPNSNPNTNSHSNPNPNGRQPYSNSRPPTRRPYDNARPGEQRPHGERPQGPGARPDYRRDSSGRPGGYRDERGSYQDRGRDNRRPDSERNERPYSRDRRPYEGQSNQRPGPDTRNPRWQSRTWTRQASPEEQQEHSSRASHNNEQFEGDYEHFTRNENQTGQRGTPPTTPYRGNSNNNHRPESSNSFQKRPRHDRAEEQPAPERHVTRLPDGRVIKGPRPIQRQEARFWTEVANDTEEIVSNVQPAEKVVNGTPESITDEAISDTTDTTDTTDKSSKKARTRSASATVRSRKAGTAKEKSKGPRPSQRGFKWPAP
jgi:hypothetical protein